MKIERFNDLQLQKIRFHYKIEDMIKLFEGNPTYIRREIAAKTLPPTTFLKLIGNSEFLFHLVRYGYDGMAKRFGVSISFLKTMGEDRFLRKGEPGFTPNVIDIDCVGSDLPDDVFDQSTVAKIFGKKIKGNLNVEGGTEAHLGRFGENIYKEIRSSKIIRDFNEEDPRSLYDFEDKDFGLVNVKTSMPHHRKGGEVYWKFSTSTGPNTKYLACLCLNHDKVPAYLIMVPYDENDSRGSFSIDRSDCRKEQFPLGWRMKILRGGE